LSVRPGRCWPWPGNTRWTGDIRHGGRGFAFGAGLGLGLYAPYAYGAYGYPYGYYGDPYAYSDYYDDDGGCYMVQRRVYTRYGWRLRPVQVCG